MENWKDIKDHEGYQVSTLGKVRSFKWGRALEKKLRLDRGGYLTVLLRQNGKYVNRKVHRLVATAFIPNESNLPLVCHKDDIPSNNIYTNLFWGSVIDNIQDKVKKNRQNRPKVDTTCKYCGLKSIAMNINRWHNENCKHKV